MEKLRKFKIFRRRTHRNEEYENFLKKKSSVIIVMGPKSCGNAVLSSMLAECSNFHLIEVSKLLLLYSLRRDSSPYVSIVSRCLEREKLVPNSVVVQILKEEILSTYESVDGFIISGFPRDLSQLNSFVKKICNVNVIVHINLKLDAFLTRLLFNDSKIDINKARIKFIKYNKKLKRVRKKYEDKIVDVKCIFPKEEAVTRLLEVLEDDFGYKFKRLYTK